MKRLLTAVAVGAALVLQVQALPIQGTLGFTGTALMDQPSVNTATTVEAWGPTLVDAVSGFAGVAVGMPVILNAPWNFAGGGGLAPLWQVDGYTFNLTSSTFFQGGGFLGVLGIGTISAAGFDTTPFAWRFTAQDPPVGGRGSLFTFSASTGAVPDGGLSLGLLGLAMVAVESVRRKLAR